MNRVAAFLQKPVDVDTAESIAHACSFTRMKHGKRECNEKWRDDGLIHSLYRKGDSSNGNYEMTYRPNNTNCSNFKRELMQERMKGTNERMNGMKKAKQMDN